MDSHDTTADESNENASDQETTTFVRVEPICPRCEEHLGIGKPEYHGENVDVAQASVWCTNTECGFEASGRFALIDLLCPEDDEPESLVLNGEIEPVEARY